MYQPESIHQKNVGLYSPNNITPKYRVGRTQEKLDNLQSWWEILTHHLVREKAHQKNTQNNIKDLNKMISKLD